MRAVLAAMTILLIVSFPLNAEEKEAGFVSLFDGKSLEGWVGDVKGHPIENGIVTCKGRNIYTAKEYADFVFRFEFKLPPGANNGVGLRTPMEGDAAFVGMESQILDDTSPQYAKLAPYQYHGSIYGVFPAKRGHLKPVGEWNEQEITCHGTRITVKLNGVVIVDGDIAEYQSKPTPDGREHPGLKRKSGHIGFLGHGSPVQLKGMRIKELK